MAPSSQKDQFMAWCPRCGRYIERTLGYDRDVIARAGLAHTKKTGHYIWLEPILPTGVNRPAPAERRYDPSRRDDREEERLRGGL